MTTTETDFAVLGAGISGCSVAYHLARLGVRRGLVLDAQTIGGGATAKSAAMVMAQTLDPVLTALAAASLETYRGIVIASAGRFHIESCGSALYTKDHTRSSLLSEAVKDQTRNGIPSEFLEPKEFVRRFPKVDCEDFDALAFCPSDGYVNQWTLLLYYKEFARERGFEFREFFPIHQIAASDGFFRLTSASDSILTRNLILASGRSSPHLAGMLGVGLTFQWNRRQIVIFQAENAGEGFPMLECIDDNWYVRPHGPDRVLVGVGPTETVVAPTITGLVDERADPDVIPRARDYLVRLLPHVAEGLVPSHWGGVRGLTADERPIIGKIRDIPNLTFCCGMSAFGVTLSGVSGQIAAALATGTTLPDSVENMLSALAPDRWTSI